MRPVDTNERINSIRNRQFQLSKKMKDCDSISFIYLFCCCCCYYRIKVNQKTDFNDADSIKSVLCKSFSDLKVRNKVRDQN